MHASMPAGSGQKDITGSLMLDAISRSTPIMQLSMTGSVLAINERYLRMVRKREEQVVGQHHSVLIHPDDGVTVTSPIFWEALKEGRPAQVELRCPVECGEEMLLRVQYAAVFDPAGDPAYVLQTATDITIDKRHSDNLLDMLEAISRSTAMIEFSMDGNVLTANSVYLQIMGYSHLDVRGRNHKFFLAQDDYLTPEYETFWSRLRAGEFIQSEFCRLGKGGKPVWLQASYNPILGPDGTPTRILKIATEVTEAVELRREMARMAFVDSLTSLGNRRKFDAELGFGVHHCAQSGSDIALLLIDIDHFKVFNDTYGHHEGDACLRSVAHAIKDAFRRDTDLVMRYGGEEFAVLLTDVDGDAVSILAEKCRSAVEGLRIENRESDTGIVSVSIGWALISSDEPRSDDTGATLIRCADAALYRAKLSGRNRVCGKNDLNPLNI
ncbi:sensor domain-containing diguanylate cyclase [Sphingomonas sp.]